MTQDPLKADFILAHGTEALGSPEGAPPLEQSLEQLQGLLSQCAQRPSPPPMVVANPDRVTVAGSGLRVMPGTLAKHYASMGGEVLSGVVLFVISQYDRCCMLFVSTRFSGETSVKNL